MSKSVSLLLGLLSLGLAAGLAFTAQRLAQSQAQLTQLTADLAAQRAQSQQDADALRKLREELATRRAVTTQLEERNHALASSRQVSGAAPGQVSAPAGEKAAAPGDFMKGFAKMFKDPAMRGAMRTQQEAGIRMIYGDLARTLGLSPTEASQVMGILADRQMDQVARGMELVGKSAQEMKPATPADKGDGAYNEQLKNVLGDQRYAALKDYEKTLPDRLALTQMQQSISATGAPLDATQSQSLLAIMSEERLKSPAETGRSAGTGPAAVTALQSDAAFSAGMERQKDLDRRVLQRAQGVLSPDQVLALEQAQKQQIELREMGLKMSRQFMAQPAKP